MTERRKTVRVPAPAASWSPSPSPPISPDVPLELSDADRLELIATHAGLKPSSLPASAESPLIVLSPEELQERVDREKPDWEVEGNAAEEEEETPLWEELANAVLWTIPFGFLFSGLDFAVHSQFGMPLKAADEFGRLCNIVPAVYFITFLVSRPRPILPPALLQSLLFVMCVASGMALIHVTSTESYLKVMRQAPGLGVFWIWSVVRLDLGPALLGLLGVAVGVWYRGELDKVKWW